MPMIPVIERVAWEYLSAERQAQLKTLLPNIFGYPVCQRCGCGQVIGEGCLQCSAEHDQDNNWLEPQLAISVRRSGTQGAGFHKRKYNIEVE